MADPSTRILHLAAARMRATRRRPFVLGIAGAQGCGKSTLAAALAAHCDCPALSLDDFYLDGAARQKLARDIHPLLRTRGVPGTHDIRAALAVIDALARPGTMRLPRFDKARDEPGEPMPWKGPADMLILEGWCLGARPQQAAELIEPINDLERERDPDASWRRWVNAQLESYRALFDRIDMLLFLAAPGFDVVTRWRAEQEASLRRARGPDAGMKDAEIALFVQHYQRLTEHMLRHGREWADLTIALDADRRMIA